MDRDILARLNAERRARRPVAVITELATGKSRLVLRTDFARDPRAPDIAAALARKVTCMALPEDGVFVNVYLPDPRLVVVGAVHITQVLAPMATLAGFSVQIVDPRGAFSDASRFAGHAVATDWPQDRFATHPLDAGSALVALSHTPGIDDPALIAALDAGCFFVGALGSRKSHAARRDRLRQAGLPEAAIARIEGPVGLPIGATTPAEVAVSILASLVRARRVRPSAAAPDDRAVQPAPVRG